MPGKAGELKIGYYGGSNDKDVIIAVVVEKAKSLATEGLLNFVTTNNLDCLIVKDHKLIGPMVFNNLQSIGCHQMLIPYETLVEFLESRGIDSNRLLREGW